MPTDQEWRELLEDADHPHPVSAIDFIKKLPGFSRSVLLTCDDGRDYSVKGLQPAKPRMARALVAEQVVGLVGNFLSAAVGEVGLVDVENTLIQAEPQMQHLEAGIAHGCMWIPGCSEKEWIRKGTDATNRRRFASLAILYGLAGAHDHQLIYENQSPHVAHSVDHGHFLPPGSAQWTEDSLRNRTTFAADQRLIRDCNLSTADLRRATEPLEDLTAERIARVAAAPPDEWGISVTERVALCDYLDRGRESLLGQHA